MPERCETPEAKAAMGEILMERWEAHRLMKTDRTPINWRRLRAACKGVRVAIDAAIYAQLEIYVTKLEAIYKTAT